MEIQLSVVIPTYKRPKLLLNCLNALAAQYFDANRFEIIVVSDGPDVLTATTLTEWNSQSVIKARYFHTAEKKGPAASRNYGWLNAKGALIAFTDDDCIPDSHWLQTFYNNFCAGGVLAMSGKTIVPISERPTDYELNTAGLQTADFITANCCCTKNVLVLTGGFDEQFAMAWREDSDLEFKLIQSGIQIMKVEQAIVIHPVRKAPWGVSITEQRKTRYNALLYKKYPKLYRQKIQPLPPVHYYGIVAAFLVMVTGVVSHHNFLLYVGLAIWASLSLLFIFMRLRAVSLAPSHLLEMVITSLFIPFLSLYWQWYGAIKYRVFLL